MNQHNRPDGNEDEQAKVPLPPEAARLGVFSWTTTA